MFVFWGTMRMKWDDLTETNINIFVLLQQYTK